jgi:hypothetical protein
MKDMPRIKRSEIIEIEDDEDDENDEQLPDTSRCDSCETTVTGLIAQLELLAVKFGSPEAPEYNFTAQSAPLDAYRHTCVSTVYIFIIYFDSSRTCHNFG